MLPNNPISVPPQNPIVIYQHFNPTTDPLMVGLKPELMQKLDTIREQCGFSLRITSGLRTKAQNDALKDAVSDSSHLSGLACDLACTDSIKRLKIVDVARANGINRIGIGNGFVHLDIDSTKLQNCMWTYY